MSKQGFMSSVLEGVRKAEKKNELNLKENSLHGIYVKLSFRNMENSIGSVVSEILSY